MRKSSKLISLSLLILLISVEAAAHKGLHEQISEVTRQISQRPGNAQLYLKRGELYRLHRDWARALADYKHAVQVAPGLEAVELARGLVFLSRNQPLKARRYLDRYLTSWPDDAGALVARARALMKLGLPLDAARDYSTAIDVEGTPNPEYYLERAQIVAGQGGEYVVEAIRGLDAGIARLGPIVTLELAAIDLELGQGHFLGPHASSVLYDSALARLDRVAAQSGRKETWLVRRGEILLQAGRIAEARRAFISAGEAIEALPPHHRRSRATIALEAHLRALLAGEVSAKRRSLSLRSS